MNDDRDGGVGDRTWSSIGRADPSGDCQLIPTRSRRRPTTSLFTEDIAMTSAVLVLALSLPGQSPQAYPAAQAPAKVAPAPQAPAKVAPAPQRSVEDCPGSLRSVEGGPGSSGGCSLRSVKDCPGSSGGCSLCSVEGGPGSLALRRRWPRLLRRLLPMLRRRWPRLPALRRRWPRLLRRLLPTLRRRLPRLLRRLLPTFRRRWPRLLRLRPRWLRLLKRLLPMLRPRPFPNPEQVIQHESSLAFALIDPARPSSIRFDDRFAGDVSHSGARRLCVCRLRAHIYWPGV